jgi:peptidoglycan hydrolase CwlO-like protein
MNNDEKILKALENLQAGQERIEKDVKDLKQGQAQHKTALEALAAGQQDIREHVHTMSGKMATKADVQDIKADLVKYQRRIENVEESTGIPNPHKN